MLAELLFQKALEILSVLGSEPTALDQEVGQRPTLSDQPGSTAFSELVGIQAARPESEDAEQQVATGV
jgi:hypothetical protein